MNSNDPFWKLSDLTEISSQTGLFEVLEKNDTVRRISYYPRTLTREEGKRQIRNKRFVNCRFSQTRIVGITFRNCTFEGCLFIGSIFRDCSFHGCSFKSTNTHKITIEKTYISPSTFDECLDKDKHQNIGTHLFQELLKNSRDEDQIRFERDARFLFLRWERYQSRYEMRQKCYELKQKSAPRLKLLAQIVAGSTSCVLRWLWEIGFGSGVRIRRFFATAVILALGISTLNYSYREELGLELSSEPITNFTEAWYFTVISLTTLGYGDVTPTTGIGQLAASIQSIVGFFLFALLASMIFRRLFP